TRTQRRIRRSLMPPTQSAANAGMAARGRRGPGEGRRTNARKSRTSARKPYATALVGPGRLLRIVAMQLAGGLFELAVQQRRHDGADTEQGVFNGGLLFSPWLMQHEIGHLLGKAEGARMA